jgi:hypothetical protein
MQQLQHHVQHARGAAKVQQSPAVPQQLARSLPPTRQPAAARGVRLVAHIAAEPRQISVQTPQQQYQAPSSPTASLSYTASFEDDSLQSIIQLQEVSLDQEVDRLQQLLQDLNNNGSSLADKVCGACTAGNAGPGCPALHSIFYPPASCKAAPVHLTTYLQIPFWRDSAAEKWKLQHSAISRCIAWQVVHCAAMQRR